MKDIFYIKTKNYMKKVVLIAIALFVTMIANAEMKVYVQKENGFILSEISIANKSINDVISILGQSPNTYYTWFSKDFKYVFCFRILSSDIICILSEIDCGDVISKEQAKQILSSNGYNYSEAYPVYQRESDLDKGIAEKNLTIKLMEELTHKKSDGQQLTDELNEYIYYFKNGVVVSYTGSDGLIGYAKEAKGTPLYYSIKNNAERVYHNQKDIVDEINKQFYYFARIKAEYLSLGKSEKYNNNYALLYVDLYCPAISMDEFLKIVHQKAEVLSIKPEQTTLKYNFNYYIFGSNKILKEIR